MQKTKYRNLFFKEDNNVITYFARFTYQGKQYTKLLGQDLTLKQAYHKLETYKTQIKKTPKKTSKSLDKIFQEWLNLKKPNITQQTYRTYLSYYNNHIKPNYEKRIINKLNFKDFQTLINNLKNIGKKPKTLKNIKAMLSTMYDYAIKMDYVQDNPVRHVEIPAFDNRIYFNLPELKIEKLFEVITNWHEPIYRDIFIFLSHGRRKSEVLNIEWSEIDLDNRIYYLPHQKNKSRKLLSFKMTDLLYSTLYNRAREYGLNGYVFLNPTTNKPYNDIRRAWHRILNEADIEHMRLHDIRHMIGFYLVNILKVPLEEVAFILGHSSSEVTSRYVNIKSEVSRDVLEAMFKALK